MGDGGAGTDYLAAARQLVAQEAARATGVSGGGSDAMAGLAATMPYYAKGTTRFNMRVKSTKPVCLNTCSLVRVWGGDP